VLQVFDHKSDSGLALERQNGRLRARTNGAFVCYPRRGKGRGGTATRRYSERLHANEF